MTARSRRPDRRIFLSRLLLLLAGLSTYFISADDAVWHFIKSSPHARRLEHICFGIAAAMLGLALLLAVQGSAPATMQRANYSPRIKAALARLLQAIGIGSLLPLPGFLILVLGEIGLSLYQRRLPEAKRRVTSWRDVSASHAGLCCAFLSMTIFSVVLIDRVADVLFAITALVSVAASMKALRSPEVLAD